MTEGTIAPEQLAILVGGALATLVMMALAFGVVGGTPERVQKRLGRLEERLASGRRDPKSGSVRLDRTDSGMPLLNLMIQTLVPNPANLRLRLVRTGLKLRLGEYVLVCVALFAGVFTLVHVGVGAGLLRATAAGCVFGILLPYQVVGFLIRRRQSKFTRLLPDAIDLMVRSLRSGLPLGEAFRSVADEVPEPVGVEFRQITDNIRLGLTMETALGDAARRVDTADIKFFVTAVAIQRETGGNLAETLEGLSEIVRSRLQLKLKVKAMSSEARASAMILSALPVVLFFILLAISRDYVLSFFESTTGYMMLGGGVASMVFGIVVMMRMANFEV